MPHGGTHRRLRSPIILAVDRRGSSPRSWHAKAWRPSSNAPEARDILAAFAGHRKTSPGGVPDQFWYWVADLNRPSGRNHMADHNRMICARNLAASGLAMALLCRDDD